MARHQARLKTLGGPDELDPTGVALVINCILGRRYWPTSIAHWIRDIVSTHTVKGDGDAPGLRGERCREVGLGVLRCKRSKVSECLSIRVLREP